MNTILKKALRGFITGLIIGAAVYLVFFVIELFSFIKHTLSKTNLTDDAISGSAASSGSSSLLGDYTPMLSVWNWSTVFLIVVCAAIIGGVIGFIVGCVNQSDHSKKIHAYNSSIIEDGSGRQKILFANNIKTTAESLITSCNENLYYMNNLVETKYTSESENQAIMTELVKFIEYEQVIRDAIEGNKKEGGC